MKLNWLGTAGFWIKSSQGEILFDPFFFLWRTAARSPYKPDDFANVEHIFLGHGHFDHAFDVPAILQKTDADVFAPGLTGHLLRMRGAPPERILKTTTNEYLFKPLKVRAFKSDHVHFDKDLVVSTAQRCGLKHCAEVIGLGVSYPKGSA